MAEAQATAATDVAAVARLRRGREPSVVAAALDLAAARKQAGPKFGETAVGLLADREGVEQASSLAVAAHKAARFAAAAGPQEAPALDLGCGIGGDLLALRRAGVRAIGIDADPLRAWMASGNASAPTAAARIEDLPPANLAGRLVHLDPARRAGGKRTRGLDAMLPGPEVVRAALRAADGGCLKLSPATVRGEAESLAPGDQRAELSFVSESGSPAARSSLVQALLWTGRLAAEQPRSAVRVWPGGTAQRFGVPSTELETAPLGGFVLVPDPALERAELLASLDLPELAPGLGVLTADARPEAPDDVWLTAFHVVAELAFREKKVVAWLRERGAGEVTVKTRGRACEPDALSRRWSGPGDRAFVVFVLRLGTAVRAIVCER